MNFYSIVIFIYIKKCISSNIEFCALQVVFVLCCPLVFGSMNMFMINAVKESEMEVNHLINCSLILIN